jgi:hypothetical protein
MPTLQHAFRRENRWVSLTLTDIPQANYAIVYSPKEDEYVMWQELSRIRSTLGNNGKDSYIL